MGKTVVRITLLLLALGAIGVAASATTSQRQVGGFVAQLPPQETPPVSKPAQAGHRHISPRIGVSLTSLLEPGDKIVEFIREDAPPFVSVDTIDPEETLATLTDIVTAVAVIKVTKKEARFTSTALGEFYSPDDWIKSTLTAEVQSVLKDSTAQLVDGNLIETQEQGGEMVLDDGRRIIARYTRTRQTTVGGTYLAFLGVDGDGRFMFDREKSLELIDGQIKGMRLDAPSRPGLEKKTPEWVVQQVRANVERRKQ